MIRPARASVRAVVFVFAPLTVFALAIVPAPAAEEGLATAGGLAIEGRLTCLTGTDPSVAGDATAIATARLFIAAACPCGAYDGTPGKTHKAYQQCVESAVRAVAGAGKIRPACEATVQKISAQSTCGFAPLPNGDVKVPCVTRSASGHVACAVKPSAQCSARSGRTTRSSCEESPFCIDAADSTGDLILDSQDDGSCGCPWPRSGALADGLAGVMPASLCVPTTTLSDGLDLITICPAQVCDDGVTSGCSLPIPSVTGSADLTSGTAQVDATLADVSLPFHVVPPSPFTPSDCSLDVSGATLDLNISFTLEPVSATYQKITGITDVQASYAASLNVSGCSLGPILNAVLGVVEPGVQSTVESGISNGLRSLLNDALTGTVICTAP